MGEGDGGVDAAGTTGVHHLGFECWQVYELLVHLPASMLQVDLRVDHTTTNRFLPLARALERLGEPLQKCTASNVAALIALRDALDEHLAVTATASPQRGAPPPIWQGRLALAQRFPTISYLCMRPL